MQTITIQEVNKLLHGFDRKQEKIAAIKYLRSITSLGLAAAKLVVERAWDCPSDGPAFVCSILSDYGVTVLDDSDYVLHRGAPVPTAVVATDYELTTLNTVFHAIDSLGNEAARKRVLEYIIARFGYAHDQ